MERLRFIKNELPEDLKHHAPCGGAPGSVQALHELPELRSDGLEGGLQLRDEYGLAGAKVAFGALLQPAAESVERGEAKEGTAAFQGMGGAPQRGLIIGAR